MKNSLYKKMQAWNLMRSNICCWVEWAFPTWF